MKKFTDEQLLATKVSGSSLLVSAAAGSGKTTVLTERVIRKLADPQNGSLADRLMILTYTNAAAAEMRSRINEALRARALREDADKEHIRRQLMLLPAAKISTIHSACLDIIKNNFHLCDIDPQFTVAEESKLMLMRADELEDFAEYVFALAKEDKDVLEVVDYFTKGKTDNSILTAIDETSAFLAKQPFEEDFTDFVCNIPENKVITDITEYLTPELEDIVRRYGDLIQAASEFDKLVELYLQESDFAELLYKHLKDGEFDKAFDCLSLFKFKRHPSRPKDVDPDKWNLLKNTRADLKDRLIKVYTDFIYSDSERLISDRKWEISIIGKFLRLCSQFNARLFEKRRKQRLMSFDDIEKYALALLVEKDGRGGFRKTSLAQELSAGIDEIIVDEFQDCNKTQDLIFEALSKDGKNIFMVGDVKQSIYRFRNAEPEIFLQKQLSSSLVKEEKDLTEPSRIDLAMNFRSNKRVLDFVNTVFDTVMKDKFGGIDYGDGHRLYPGPDADKSKCTAAELHLLVSGSDEDTPMNKLSKTEAEARYVANMIKNLVGREKIYDAKIGEERLIRYDDIAVLMRAPKTDGGIFEAAFAEAGIPFINNNPAENYLDTPEVRSVLAFLQTIDNPYNDIPLVTLMYSDFFSFTAEELAKIRSKNKRMLFFDAVKEYAKTDARTMEFIKNLEYLRTLSMTTDVYGIISAVYETSGILLRLSAKENGESARANLSLLLDYAENFESGRYRGLFAFISYIAKLSEKKETIPAARLKSSGNSVSILSIHRSKGLEYGVVFVVGAGNDLRCMDKQDVLLDKDLGAGCHIRDTVRHRDFSSASRNLLHANNLVKDLAEYMRLLYVALTRPKQRLYVTGIMGVTAVENAVRSAYLAKGNPEKYDMMRSPSFIRWMLYSLILSKNADKFCSFAGVPADLCTRETEINLVIENVSDYEREDKTEKQKETRAPVSTERAKKLITREYAFLQDTLIPSKLSVSEIKNMKTGETKTAGRGFAQKPRFIQGVSGTDKGNATHRFLQFCDFDKITGKASFDKEKTRLEEYGFITAKEAELVETDKILRFLASDTMRFLSEKGTCFKEQRFLFTVPANEITDTDSEEEIIVQGIIDLLYIIDGKAVIVDYKTDRVNSEQQLADRYKAQLDMYETAVKRIRNTETAHKYIYSFCLETFIEV